MSKHLQLRTHRILPLHIACLRKKSKKLLKPRNINQRSAQEDSKYFVFASGIVGLCLTMNIPLHTISHSFTHKPLLVGGQAKEYYGIRKSGSDIDLVVSSEDFKVLEKQYPENKTDLWGDLGIKVREFEIWKSIVLFDYDYLSEGAVEKDKMLIVSLEKLLFLTALGIKKSKYEKDLRLIVQHVIDTQYRSEDDVVR